MYISNMQHFLDKTPNIPKQMPKEARELASFMALVVDSTTKISISHYPKLKSCALKKVVRG